MRFDSYSPCPLLQPYIKNYIVSEQANEQSYKVLPDTSLVIGFQYRGILSHIGVNKENILSAAGITGLHDTFRIFKNSVNTGTVLVFFTETGAARFFKIPLNELFSQSLSLAMMLKSSLIAETEEQLAEAKTDLQRISVIERFLISQYMPGPEDLLVKEAVRLIMQGKGTMRIADLAQKLHTSQSPLEKRFRKTVGTTAKKFFSVIRLKSLINNADRHGSMANAGYAAGYYDQSHFINDFKLFTGETPEKFFSQNIK